METPSPHWARLDTAPRTHPPREKKWGLTDVRGLVKGWGGGPETHRQGTTNPRTCFPQQNVIAEHEIRNISCAAQDPEDLCTFAYITKDLQTSHHYCHVFSTVDVVSTCCSKHGLRPYSEKELQMQPWRGLAPSQCCPGPAWQCSAHE
jgi:hypothetical protein